jgi:hypothetical protein
MGLNAPHDQQRAPQPDIFWRRRAIALALGIAVVGLLAWAVNGVIGGSSATSQTAAIGHPEKAAAGPAAAPTTPFVTPSGASASASASASPSASPTGSPTGTPTPTRKTETMSHTGDGCPAGDVVISLSANGQGAGELTYGPGAVPEFGVTVVSTAPHTCAFDISAKDVRVVIKSGPARIWASSDCAPGASSRTTRLARGVPAMLHMAWNRKTSVPGCGPAGIVARPGTYTATVYSGPLRSNTVVFVLRGTAVAGA